MARTRTYSTEQSSRRRLLPVALSPEIQKGIIDSEITILSVTAHAYERCSIYSITYYHETLMDVRNMQIERRILPGQLAGRAANLRHDGIERATRCQGPAVSTVWACAQLIPYDSLEKDINNSFGPMEILLIPFLVMLGAY